MSPTSLVLRAILHRDGGDGGASTASIAGPWWWSSQAYAVKWGIIGGIFVVFLALFLGGHWHAQRRIKKGLQPLPYHRWLLTRSQRARFASPRQNNFSFYRQQDGYAMHGYAPPPPAYNRDADNAPAYTPPQGASKINPSQNYAEMPPPGSPPPHSGGGASSKAPEVTMTTPEAVATSYRR